MSPPASLMTAEELLRTHTPHKRTELVQGMLVVRAPAGSRHGLVTMNLGAELAVYAKQTGAGADWLPAGTRLVWVLDPQRRLARVYRHDGSETSVTAEDARDGEDVLA